MNNNVTIRRAHSGDDAALQRLAALDSHSPLEGPVLVAEADGVIEAAVALTDRAVIADPFVHTAASRQLLLRRADQLSRSHPRLRARLRTPRFAF